MPDGTVTDEQEAFEAASSEYPEKSLPAERAREVDAHLQSCDRCRAEYARFRDTVGMISGLDRVPAPTRFEREVEATIHRRSAGRFFGRRAFGDRVPFELLAAIGLLLVVAVVLLLRWSPTGTVHDPLSPSPSTEPRPDVKKSLPTP